VSREEGSATVETIIWLPLLLLLFGAVIQYGLYFNAKTAVQVAAFEAARQAAVSDKPVEVAENVAYGFANSTLPGWREGERVAISISAPSDPEPGDSVNVQVTYRVPGFFTGILPALGTPGQEPTIIGSARMLIEERP